MSQDYQQLPLRAYFLGAYAPAFLSEARASTLAVYATTISLWDRLMPPLRLGQIDNRRLAEFRTKLVHENNETLARPISPHTANKYLRAINAMLAKAGPAARTNRDGLGILENPPWVKLAKAPVTRPRAIPLDVLGLIYRACDAARVPCADGIDPAEWWRGLVVCASQTGIRRSALLGLEFRDWSDVDRTLRVSAAHDKMGVERLKPVNAVLTEHLNTLWQYALYHEHQRAGGDRKFMGDTLNRKIFPWPYRSLRMFYIQWHALQQAAGVPLEELYHFHDLKKTCGTQLATVAGAHAVREMLDHSTIEMSQHYVSGGEQLREALEKMPRPVEFERGEIHHGGTEGTEGEATRS